MRRVLIFPFTILFLLLFSLPALADAQLNLNGRDYNNNGIIIQDGVSYASTNTLVNMLGCDVVVEGNTVTLQENTNNIRFEVGSKTASVNDAEKLMPAAPFWAENQVFLPIRFVAESLGAEVSWDDLNKSVVINYTETRNGLTAEELTAKSSEKMLEANSYKMNLDMDMNIEMSGQDNGTPVEPIKMETKSNAECWVQYNPLVMYMIQKVNIPENNETPATEVQTEMVLKDNIMYMTMPEIGWVKMDLAGLGNIQDLMNQSLSMDPAATMKLLNEMGVYATLANDQELNGQKYWVVNITMGKEMLESDYFKQILQSMAPLSSEGLDLTKLFNDIDFNLSTSSWINQATLLTDFMSMNGTITMNMDLSQQGIPSTMNMLMDIDGSYTVSDYGKAFDLPNVSEAVDFDTLMTETPELE
jgi:hypothetical protein